MFIAIKEGFHDKCCTIRIIKLEIALKVNAILQEEITCRHMYAPALKETLFILSSNLPLVTEDRGLNRAVFSVIISESVDRFALNIFVVVMISSNFAFVIFKHLA